MRRTWIGEWKRCEMDWEARRRILWIVLQGLLLETSYQLHRQSNDASLHLKRRSKASCVHCGPPEVSLHGWIVGCYGTIELQASHRDSGSASMAVWTSCCLFLKPIPGKE